MEPHERRVAGEKLELDERIGRLGAFIGGNPAFGDLGEAEAALLRRQLAAMVAYSDILGERIGLFSR